jgi:hypothetical protein
MKPIRPARPENLDPLASLLLERLRDFPEAANVVIGGVSPLTATHRLA